MCGIAGLLLRDERLTPRLGELLATMLGALDERGQQIIDAAEHQSLTGSACRAGPAHRRRNVTNLVTLSELAATLRNRTSTVRHTADKIVRLRPIG